MRTAVSPKRLSQQMRAVLGSPNADAVVAAAIRVLEMRASYGPILNSPASVADCLRLRLNGLEHEVFVCVWMDAQHRVLAFQEVFRGTLTQTSVYT